MALRARYSTVAVGVFNSQTSLSAERSAPRRRVNRRKQGVGSRLSSQRAHDALGRRIQIEHRANGSTRIAMSTSAPGSSGRRTVQSGRLEDEVGSTDSVHAHCLRHDQYLASLDVAAPLPQLFSHYARSLSEMSGRHVVT
jgi:hypothetical protein